MGPLWWQAVSQSVVLLLVIKLLGEHMSSCTTAIATAITTANTGCLCVCTKERQFSLIVLKKKKRGTISSFWAQTHIGDAMSPSGKWIQMKKGSAQWSAAAEKEKCNLELPARLIQKADSARKCHRRRADYHNSDSKKPQQTNPKFDKLSLFLQ